MDVDALYIDLNMIDIELDALQCDADAVLHSD